MTNEIPSPQPAPRHTPGPWALNRAGAIIGGKVYEFANGSSQKQVAMACVVDEDNGDQVANARLIAAAPELLEALTALVDRNFTFMSGGMVGASKKITHAEVMAARHAIAKATGAQA